MTTQVLDPARLRRVFGAFPTGVTAVAALADDEPIGLTANSFTSVSLEPAITDAWRPRADQLRLVRGTNQPEVVPEAG